MDLTSYDGLKAAIGTFLNRTDLTDATGGFIALAEAQMARRFVSRMQAGMNVPRRLVKRATADVTQGQEYIAVPADFLGPLQLIVGGASPYKLNFLELNNFQAKKLGCERSGRPRYYTLVGNELQIYPTAEEAGEIAMIYLARVAPLTSLAANWILFDYPDAYLYGALTASAPYLKDDARIAVWSTLFVAAVDDICNADPLPNDKAILQTDVPVRSRLADSNSLSN